MTILSIFSLIIGLFVTILSVFSLLSDLFSFFLTRLEVLVSVATLSLIFEVNGVTSAAFTSLLSPAPTTANNAVKSNTDTAPFLCFLIE